MPGLFVRNGEHLSAEDKLLLMSVACLYLDDRAGGIIEQLNQRIHTLKSPARAFIPRAVRERNQHTDWSPDTRMGGSIRSSFGKMRLHRLPGRTYWQIPVLAA